MAWSAVGSKASAPALSGWDTEEGWVSMGPLSICLSAGAGPGEQVQDEAWSRLAEAPGVPLGLAAGQPVTVKVADATEPLWRPLALKVSLRPG
jgi:hypothetical protein